MNAQFINDVQIYEAIKVFTAILPNPSAILFQDPQKKGGKMALNSSFILESLSDFNHLCNTKYMCVYVYIYIHTHICICI